jgi:hypothetical protein
MTGPGYRRTGAWVLLLCCVMPVVLLAQDPPSRVLVEGEELVYNVRYSFIDLGQIRIKTAGKTRVASYEAYEARALIDSYKGVPFVDLHAVFESMIDTAVFSRHFTGKVKEDSRWDFARYTFEYDKKRVLMEIGHLDTVVSKRETLTVDRAHHDGLSLFFFARDQLFSGKKMNVPALITEKKVNAYIDFSKERAAVEIDAVDYPVDVIKFEGNAEFVGIFGLTGEFTGWFSNDEARVPIMAKMKVIIGSVTIELMKWTRPGWSPPRGQG